MMNNPMANNGVPGLTMSRPGEAAVPARNVTRRRMIPMGLAGLGRPPYEEVETVTLGEDGTLTTEIEVRVSTCAGCAALIKTRDDAGETCLFHGFVLCEDCKQHQRFKCTGCGRQGCSFCIQKVNECDFLCPVCRNENEIGGELAWSSISRLGMDSHSKLGLPMPTWGQGVRRSGLPQAMLR